MRWLRPSASRREREKGAVATIAAVLVASGVVMAMLALTVDVGNIVAERRQLQNGADAAAMLLAGSCARGNTADCTNTSAARQNLQNLASANAGDGATAIRASATSLTLPTAPYVCTNDTAKASGLPLCTIPSSAAELDKCMPLAAALPAGAAYVEVRAQSKDRTNTTDDSTNPLTSFFAKAVINGYSDKVYTACSRAAWGPGGPSTVTVLPLAVSECDWRSQTGYPTSANYPSSPSGAWPGYSNTDARPDWPTTENTIYAKGNPTSCDTSSPGGTAPGGFAWLDGYTGGCSAVVTDNAWLHGDTGNDGCDTSVFDPLRGTMVYIPVFDCMMGSNPGREPIASDDCNSGSGNGTYYHISGFAAFYVSGWRLTKGSQNSVRPPNALCGSGNADRCVSGWFLKDLVQGGSIVPSTPTNPNYGFQVVNPLG
jgi:Flp pilus assembly protein TadG